MKIDHKEVEVLEVDDRVMVSFSSQYHKVAGDKGTLVGIDGCSFKPYIVHMDGRGLECFYASELEFIHPKIKVKISIDNFMAVERMKVNKLDRKANALSKLEELGAVAYSSCENGPARLDVTGMLSVVKDYIKYPDIIEKLEEIFSKDIPLCERYGAVVMLMEQEGATK